MTTPNDPTNPSSKEPVPITGIWPRRSLEEVLADLRGDGSTDFNPQKPEFSPSVPLPPSQLTWGTIRYSENKGNCSSDSDDSYIYIYAPSLEERDSQSAGKVNVPSPEERDSQSKGEEYSSEEGDDSRDKDYVPTDGCKDLYSLIAQLEPDSQSEGEEYSSEEGDDSRDKDYVPTDGCTDPHPLIAQLEPANSQSEGEEYSSEEGDDSRDKDYVPTAGRKDPHRSSKRTGSNTLVFKRRSSVVPIDEEQVAAQIPVPVSGSGGKRRDSKGKTASTLNISSQVLSLNQNDGVGAKEDWLLRNSREDTLFGIAEETKLQKRCQGAKESLLDLRRTGKRKNREI